ncbi:hypothetical protein FH972_008873 [Carpinus fangiana]|uniref:Uncharacterized protein n=1 Tax=Carpinus fangiana TaxID=176857 RepID=A0A5N6R1M3_9ROSI|nr:hypothetical protein FH972_008873 [Carpinus fangiana]
MARSPSSTPPPAPSSPLPAMSRRNFSPKRPRSLPESVLSEAQCVATREIDSGTEVSAGSGEDDDVDVGVLVPA